MKKVLIIGPPSTSQGGVSSVIKQFVDYEWPNNLDIKYLITYHEKNRLLLYLISLLKFIKYLIFRNFDIIHIHMSYGGSFYRKFPLIILSKVFNRKIIIHLHGSEFESFYYKSNLLIQFLIKKSLMTADIVIVLGDNWNNIIKKINPNINTCIVNNSIRVPKIMYQSNLGEKLNILFLGSLIVRKGIYDLIEALELLMNENILQKYNVLFHICGRGIEEEKLRVLVEEKNLSSYVEFHGWIIGDEKKKLLESSDLFVLPSYNEGLPIAILESMSYGIPIISTCVGSINEAIENGINGYLITPGDYKSLKDKLELLIEDNVLRASMGEKSYEICKEKFCEERYFEVISNLYNNLYN